MAYKHNSFGSGNSQFVEFITLLYMEEQTFECNGHLIGVAARNKFHIPSRKVFVIV